MATEGRVFVLDTNRKPLAPTMPARARRLLNAGKAAVFRRVPFTIILKRAVELDPQPAIEFKVDPGSRTSGLALIGNFPKQGRVVLWAANLHHRGQAIKDRLKPRRSLRRSRRARKTRYRAPRFDNRTRPKGWLPPSLQSRVLNVASWFEKLLDRAQITECHIETVRFDTQALQYPEISGVEYQQGELAGHEVREYLLEKWQRKCAYCGKENVPLEIEHINPRSNGGSNRVSNLTLACHACNEKKSNRDVREFLEKKPDALKRILTHAKAPLKDAAAVNATRYAIGNAMRAIGLPTSFWSGGRTKHNRVKQGYAKDHWIDAACVGETGERVCIPERLKALEIKATGWGRRQVVRTDRYGFPCARAGRVKRVHRFQTGDIVKLIQPSGKYAGEYIGRLSSIRSTGRFVLAGVTASFKNYVLLQRGNGYAYAH
jgi:Restriction endonuclease